SAELITRVRGLRFFKAVRTLQEAYINVRNHPNSNASCPCSKCNLSNIPPAQISILTLCGHMACEECLQNRTRAKDECVIEGCSATARDFQVVKAPELGLEDERAAPSRHYSKKIEDIVDLIRYQIPKEDQVLLFVQFDDMMDKVSTALTEN